MQYTECSSNITKMYNLYGKKAPALDALKNYFDFLEEYNANELQNAIKNFIKKSKFLPTVAELVEEIEKQRKEKRTLILDYMLEEKYFFCIEEYEKAVSFIENGVVPDWFKEAYKEYYLEFKKNERVARL